MRINLFTIVSTLAIVLAVSIVSIAQAQQPSQLTGAVPAPEAMQQNIPEGMIMILVPGPGGIKPMLIPKEVFDQINKETAPVFNTPADGGSPSGTEESVQQGIEDKAQGQGGTVGN